MEWPQLDTLKKMLQDTDVPYGAWDYFTEHIFQNDDFTRASKMAPDNIKKLFEPVAKEMVMRILGKSVTVEFMLITGIVSYHFYHGYVRTSGGNCLVLYFHDIRLGLVGFSEDEDSTEVNFSLFDTVADAFLDKKAPLLFVDNQTGH